MTIPVSYTNVSRVYSAYPPISSVTAITSAVIAELYAGPVEAEINARINEQVSLPLTVECPLLTAIATRETIFRITVERLLVQFPPAQQGQHPLQLAHKADQDMIADIAAGKITLLDSSLNAIAGPDVAGEIYSTTKDYVPTMHEGSIYDQVQDPTKLDDIISDRDL